MDVRELASRRSALKNTITTLTSERTSLAPRAVNGHADGPSARARIAAIDAERAAAMAELETTEAALASPEIKHASLVKRLDEGFQKRKRTHQNNLVVMLRDAYRGLATGPNLERQLASAKFAGKLDDFADYIEALPRTIAATLTREAVTADELVRARQADELMRQYPNYDDQGRVARLEIELAVFKAHTTELLDTFPDLEVHAPIPPELIAKLEAARPKQAADGVMVGGFTRAENQAKAMAEQSQTYAAEEAAPPAKGALRS